MLLQRIGLKMLNKICASRIQQNINETIYYDQIGLVPEVQYYFNICKMPSVRLLIEQRKTCMAISTDAEKPFNAIHIHYDKYSQQTRDGREPSYLQQNCRSTIDHMVDHMINRSWQ